MGSVDTTGPTSVTHLEGESGALWQLERGFWSGDADYYRNNVAEDGVMVFPGMVLGKSASVASIAAAPRWSTFTFTDQRFLPLTSDVVALQYRATGRREGDAGPYRALALSVYVRREGGWKLAVHQQTPETTQATR